MPEFVLGTFVSVTTILFVLLTSGRLEASDCSTTPAQSADQSAPLLFEIGDATITPVGFMDLTNTWRSTNIGWSLQTNFAAILYSNTPQGRIIEDNFTAANSPVGLRVDTKVRDVNVSATGRVILLVVSVTPPSTRKSRVIA